MAVNIPALFAIPAGFGEIPAGSAAWHASRAIAERRAEARRHLMRAI
jgi:hypothetical protein